MWTGQALLRCSRVAARAGCFGFLKIALSVASHSHRGTALALKASHGPGGAYANGSELVSRQGGGTPQSRIPGCDRGTRGRESLLGKRGSYAAHVT